MQGIWYAPPVKNLFDTPPPQGALTHRLRTVILAAQEHSYIFEKLLWFALKTNLVVFTLES